MLHASVRIYSRLLSWPRSKFTLIPLRILVQIHYSSEMWKNHTQAGLQRKKSQASNHWHVCLHLDMIVLKATKDKESYELCRQSGWRPAREKKSIFHEWKRIVLPKKATSDYLTQYFRTGFRKYDLVHLHKN